MPEEASLAEERWVRIMADYCADGVWHRKGAGDSADELPIGATLIARIRRWQDWYESESPLLPASEQSFDGEAFVAEGLAIARAVKAALPDWTVVDLRNAVVAGDGDTPHNAFEREIE